MGLDIMVLQPKKCIEISKEDRYLILSDHPELETLFGKFAVDKTNNYYDIKGELTKLGYELDDVEECGMEFGKIAIFTLRDKGHKLCEVYRALDEIWSKAYYNTKKELLGSKEYKIYLKYLPTLKELGYKPRYKFTLHGGKIQYNLNSAWRFADKGSTITIKDPSTIDKVERCLAYEEIGWQRKGANKQFYEDKIWDHPSVTTKEKLLEHWDKYFSLNTPNSIGGFGSDTEIEREDCELRARFKENIVDKFIEGENFVVYW